MVTIAIDAMGGDHGLKSTIPGVLMALKSHAALDIILVGNSEHITRYLKKLKANHHPRISIVHTSEVVEMDEAPSYALRNKKDSSMRVAINLVKEGRANACVSSGNTGALMATSRFVLKMLPGIDRPAIVSVIPGIDPKTRQRTKTYMLDLGANVDCTADNLYQFALMASIRTRLVGHIDNPRVALLNIGEEEMKGLDVIKEAAKKIEASHHMNYIGFVEGNDLLSNRADVVVCDGFVGNVALKSIEGTAKFIGHVVKDAFTSNIFTKFLALFALPALNKIKKNLDVREYNGASFLGLNGIVIKSHGSADAYAFLQAIGQAINEVEHNLLEQIAGMIAKEIPPVDNAQVEQVPNVGEN